jgi:carbon-monoxide dehydrogenase large subunit
MTILENPPTRTAYDYVGTPVLRREDRRFLTGGARYVEDIVPFGLLHASVVRSTVPHAHIVGIDTAAAAAAPGVVAVLTEADFPGDELPVIPTDWIPPVMTHIPTRYAMARGTVRFVGEAIAVVVAETRALADDAAALVEVTYDRLPHVTDSEASQLPGAPRLHEDFATNTAFVWHMGAANDEVDAAIDAADVQVELRLENQRVAASSLEGRVALADFNAATGKLTLHSGTQNVHVVRRNLSIATGIPEHQLQVVAPAVGGGFGAKLCLYPEDALTAIAARRLGRPVKWAQTRTEDFVSTSHGRDHVEYVRLGATREGRITALRVQTFANVGGYISGMGAGIPCVFALMVAGCYDVPVVAVDVHGCLTNTTTTETYRGAGRPEAAYLIERTVDALAARLGADPVGIRKLNFIAPERFPHMNGVGFTHDSGEYAACLDKALELISYDEARRLQAEARAAGRYVGIGIGSYVEFCGFGDCTFLGFDRSAWEQAVVIVSRAGKVSVQLGTVAAGQGHETTIAQIVAQQMGLPIDEIDILSGDTDISSYGTGTYNSRSISNAGSASQMAATKVMDKARRVAAHMLEADADDLRWENGSYSVAGSPGNSVTWAQVSQRAIQGNDLPEGLEPTLKEMAIYKPPNFTSPFGAHIAMVEVDPETGAVEILRYIAVDDCGTIINPLLVTGQVHGGIAQGIGQTMTEKITFDSDGQPTSASYLEYGVPRAHQMPHLETAHTVTETPYNPLGAKGIGESGIIGPPPAITNAVLDALRPLGVEHVDMPLTPARVWAAIQGAHQ